MSRRIGSWSVGLLLCASACADIWRLQDFQEVRGDGAADEPDATVAQAADADAGPEQDVLAAVEAGPADAPMSSGGDSGDAGPPPADAAPYQADAACPGPCPAGATCDNGACACQEAPNLCPTACVDFTTDPGHCGSCAVACPSGAACEAGVCACPAAQPSTCGGACVDTKTDHANCGGCGTPCATDSACHAGVCTKCGSYATDNLCSGVCIDVSLDDKNCGSCGHSCPSGASCKNGVCTCPPGDPTTCPAATTDAGTCVDTVTDHNNCGGCGNVCKLAHATSGCDKSCIILSCTAGYSDCDMTASTGCEIHTTNDPSNCNGCRNVCALTHATAGCTNSTCVVAACATGYGSCDGIDSNGCETNTRTDTNNCGACSTAGASHACTGGKVCQGSACVCPAGTHACSGTCVSDSSTSLSSCGTTCAPCVAPTHGAATCSGVVPVCGKVCDNVSYPTLCAGACVNTMNDNNNCSGCGAAFACPSGTSCMAGVCTSGMEAGSDASVDATAGDAAGGDAAAGE
ncbi:MAG TPA: hypothetical protein VN894_07985 [Polyangiaceae bacterium]|nr:hypothetical protein [Polyangiaceae bacterium]